uniref:Uncharacterized protein n=1 Tax=Tanacetum cinerariifolium TaxID=118510 RepID=A0A6L2J4R6_TANCI|nr:hypothetical protein [Tanacetum cinerariifolium]
MSKDFRAKAKGEREIRDQVLQYSMLRDYVVELQSTNPNTIVKILVKRNTNPSLPARGWCGQAYKDFLWRAASATHVRDFKKCRAKSDLLLNNIYEVFNGKIVKDRDKLVITLLEYTREYCMKRIMNVQGGKNIEASGSASRQAQQTERIVGQDGSDGSGACAVIGLSAAAGKGVANQGSFHSRWPRKEYKQKEVVHKKELPLNLHVNLLPVLKCQ